MTWLPPTTPGVVRGERVAIAGAIVPATLHIAGGRIMRLSHLDDLGGARSRDVLEAGEMLVIPGLVDTHVHVNEPGRTEWEGFESATRAAAAGGVTTVLDMPLNSIPATTKPQALERKRLSAAGKCHVDVGFLGGLVPGNTGDLPQLWADGVFGFKCFLVPSGVDEFRRVTLADVSKAMPTLAQLRAPLLVHAEHPAQIDAATAEVQEDDPRRYATYLASRPPSAEVEAVRAIVDLARRHNVHVHIVHVSTSEVISMLRDARADRIPVTAETCPHYLAFSAEQIADGATQFKCAPPIRGNVNRDRLWDALREGVLDFIVSDHSPCPPALKRLDSGNFFEAWGGVASLELTAAVIATQLRARSISFAHLAQWMCEGPARLAGLYRTKGRLAAGYQADIALLDDAETFVVDPTRLHQRHRVTPYAGLSLHGRVRATYLRGQLIYDGSEMVGGASGRLLRRATT